MIQMVISTHIQPSLYNSLSTAQTVMLNTMHSRHSHQAVGWPAKINDSQHHSLIATLITELL